MFGVWLDGITKAALLSRHSSPIHRDGAMRRGIRRRRRTGLLALNFGIALLSGSVPVSGETFTDNLGAVLHLRPRN